MRVYRDLNEWPDLTKSVVTIGSFDGVHTGHQKILNRVTSLAQANETTSVVITFHPHPRSIVYPNDKSLRLLSSLQEKIDLLEKYDVDVMVIVPFTIEFSQISPQEYIEKLLIDKFQPSYIVIGYDHRFGLNRAGDINMLKDKAEQYDYKVEEILKQEIDEITISSTKIRTALQAGDLDVANTLLNHAYSVSGLVVKGRQVGTEIGFPTANLDIEEPKKLIPKNGIYACEVVIDKVVHRGMLYIGDIPTIGRAHPTTIEVNIFDFDKDIYGQRISIRLLKHLRDDRKFESFDALKLQLARDREASLSYFSGTIQTRHLDTTIAILNYNSNDYLETFLPSVSLSSDADFETLVIDNNSDESPEELLSEWFPEVKLVGLSSNHGFAEGYNRGLVDVSTKYTVFLNSDVEVTEYWLDPLVAYLESHPSCAAVMPKILSYEDKQRFEYAGAAGGYIDYLGYPFCRGRLFDTIEKDEGQYNDEVPVFWVSGAAFVMRTEVFKALGGFDRDFFAHQEEIDLCWRVQRAGYNLAVIPSSKVYHVGGGTLAYGSPHKVFLNFRNSLSTIFKNEKASRLIWVIPIRLVLDGVAGIKFGLQGEFKNLLAVIKAHFAFYGRLPSLISKRRAVTTLIDKLIDTGIDKVIDKLIDKSGYNLEEEHSVRPKGGQRVKQNEQTKRKDQAPDIKGILHKSVVFNYFLSGQKKFKDLKF